MIRRNGTSVWKYSLWFQLLFPSQMKHVFLSKIVNHVRFVADHDSVWTIIRSVYCLMIIWLESFLTRLHHPYEKKIKSGLNCRQQVRWWRWSGKKSCFNRQSQESEEENCITHTINSFGGSSELNRRSLVVVVMMGAASFSLFFQWESDVDFLCCVPTNELRHRVRRT